jgi:hypothetical protein
VLAPATRRGAVDRLAHLVDACRSDWALGFVEPQASLVPGEAEEIKYPTRLSLDVLDHCLVVNLKKMRGGQRRAPVCHEFLIGAVVAPEFGLIVGDLSTMSFDGVNCVDTGRGVWDCSNLGPLRLTETIGADSIDINVVTTAVPVPGTWTLLITGLLGLGGVGWRGRRDPPLHG